MSPLAKDQLRTRLVAIPINTFKIGPIDGPMGNCAIVPCFRDVSELARAAAQPAAGSVRCARQQSGCMTRSDDASKSTCTK